MPLYSVPDMKRMQHIPHFRDTFPIMERIPVSDMELIVNKLNSLIDDVCDTDKEILTSSWIPGSDWSGTVWHPIWLAAQLNNDLAGKVFGCLVWQAFALRPEDWAFGKGYQVDGRDIKGTTYFRINR